MGIYTVISGKGFFMCQSDTEYSDGFYPTGKGAVPSAAALEAGGTDFRQGPCSCPLSPAVLRWLQAFSADEVVVDGVEGKLRVFFHAHLIHDSCAVRADGLDAQKEIFGDLGNRFSLCEHQHDLVLTV